MPVEKEEEADAKTVQAALLKLKAHPLGERAEGTARAVELSREGRPWAPAIGPVIAAPIVVRRRGDALWLFALEGAR